MSDPSYEELKAKLAQLEKEVEVKKRSGDLSFKIGEKGGLSVYGLGRFPVTLITSNGTACWVRRKTSRAFWKRTSRS
jgi:hypothetical protein